MLKPHYKEEFRWFEIEFYNAEDVAHKGEYADIKKYSTDILPPIEVLKEKAKEIGYDSIAIKKCIENQEDYYFG